MSVFEKRLSSQMLYFVKKNHQIILQWSWGSRGTLTVTAGPGGSPKCLGGKAPEKSKAIYAWMVNNS